MDAQAQRLLPPLRSAPPTGYGRMHSQIGSGAQPQAQLGSAGLRITTAQRGGLDRLAAPAAATGAGPHRRGRIVAGPALPGTGRRSFLAQWSTLQP